MTLYKNAFPSVLTRQLIGFDELFRSLDPDPIRYPLRNILKQGNRYRIDFALAGYHRDQIQVTRDHNELIVQTKPNYISDSKSVIGNNEELDPNDWNYLHKDISTKTFVTTIRLTDHLEIKDVIMKDGILSIFLELEIPEKFKPKTFQIK